jgi:hypothetical protein
VAHEKMIAPDDGRDDDTLPAARDGGGEHTVERYLMLIDRSTTCCTVAGQAGSSVRTPYGANESSAVRRQRSSQSA